MIGYRMMAVLALTATCLAGGSVVLAEASSRYGELLGHYDAIRLALLADALAEVPAAASKLADTASNLGEDLSPEVAGVAAEDFETLEPVLKEIAFLAQRLGQATDLDTARQELFLLTRPMARYRRLVGDDETIVAYCSMAQKAWIQPDGELGNPYMGQSMPRCGEVVGE